MASNCYPCVCGRLAEISMWEWLYTKSIVIRCECGLNLSSRKTLFGFTFRTARYAWVRYMKEICKESE